MKSIKRIILNILSLVFILLLAIGNNGITYVSPVVVEDDTLECIPVGNCSNEGPVLCKSEVDMQLYEERVQPIV